MADTPFVPFIPAPTLQSSGLPGEPNQPAPAKQSRKKRAPPAAEATPAPAKPVRKKREPKAAAPAGKFDLQTAMQIGAMLHDLGEQAVFFKLHADISKLPKKVRQRVVAALNKVFA